MNNDCVLSQLPFKFFYGVLFKCATLPNRKGIKEHVLGLGIQFSGAQAQHAQSPGFSPQYCKTNKQTKTSSAFFFTVFHSIKQIIISLSIFIVLLNYIKSFSLLFSKFFLTVGIETRARCMLSTCSTTNLCPEPQPSLF